MSIMCNKLLLKASRLLFHKTVIPQDPLLVSVRYFGTSPKGKKGLFKLGILGVGIGALVGTGYSIHHLNKPNTHILNEQTKISLLENVPQIQPSRRVVIPGDQSGLKLVLYQYQTCPFCCKVRAFLDYHGISYDIVEVDPVLRQAIKWSEYKKVPILVAKLENGYQPLNDSSMIISALATYLRDDRNLNEIVEFYPFISYVEERGSVKREILNKYFIMKAKHEDSRSKEEIENERKWRKWSDEVLVHTLSPNVYRTFDEALQAFSWFSDVGEWDKHFPAWERFIMIYVGASAMWVISKRLKKRYNLKDDVRQSLYDDCDHWAKAIKNKGTRFMGGDEPNLSDLAVYGVLSSIEGCNAFKDLLRHSKIKDWYWDMKKEVTRHGGALFA